MLAESEKLDRAMDELDRKADIPNADELFERLYRVFREYVPIGAVEELDAKKSTPSSCQTCRWWRGPDATGGQCRRMSPVGNYDWPRTFENDWCGEYESRIDDSAQE